MKNYLTNWFIKILFIFNIYVLNANNFDWQDIEVKAQNAVVQVWAQKAEFNWLEPYKSPKQYGASGSAFFINEEGDLLTNFHVVSECQSVFINVPICGRKPLEVNIKGVCPELDVALLSLTKESYEYLINVFEESGVHHIPFLNLGDSDNLYRTEPVLALGFPLSQRYLKSTVGVIAGRDFMFGESFIHITAPINHGNSGGPLLNLRGEVVGINSGGIPNAQNIGYIRPINDAKNILDYLHTIRLYKKPELGININHATNEHTNFLKNPTPGGAYINLVYKDSIAQKAGIKVGDMLYEVIWNGQSYKIDEYGDLEVDWRSSDKISLEEFFHRFRLSDPVTLVIYRNGERLEINCNFDTPPNYPLRRIYPDFEPEAKKDYEIFAGGVFMQLRLNHLKDLNYKDVLPEQAQFFLKKYYSPELRNEEVVIITSLLPGSQLHKVDCFHVGDIIEEVNAKQIKNIQDLREALLLSVESGNIAVKTKEGIFTVLSLNKVLDEESKLAIGYIFPISQTIQKITQLVNKSN